MKAVIVGLAIAFAAFAVTVAIDGSVALGQTTGAPATPTNTAVPATATPVPPTNTPTPVPTELGPTPVLVAPEIPRVTPVPLTTPPPAATPIPTVNPATGGQLLQIPAGTEVGAVAVITPAANDPVGASFAVPAPMPGAPPFVARVQPVDSASLGNVLPAGATAARAIDFSVKDPTSGETVALEGIKVQFRVTQAEVDAGNLTVFRIDTTVTPNRVEALTCDLDQASLTLICNIEKTSIFALGRTATQQAITYRAFVSNVAKNAAPFLRSGLPANAVSSYSIYNNGERTATVTVTFYATGGATSGSVTYTVLAGRSAFQYVPNLTDLADGTYSAVFQSDQPFSVSSNVGSALGAAGGVGSAAVLGVRETVTARELFVPAVYRSYFGFDSAITVQNTDLANATDATITVRTSTGAVAMTATLTIAPGAAQAFDLSPLAPGSVGAAQITADRDVTATSTVFTASGSYASGTAARAGSSVLYASALYNDYFGYTSSVVVQNTEGTTADVTVEYSNGTTRSFQIAGNTSAVLFQPNEGLPAGFAGGAQIRSTNGAKLVGTVNVLNGALGRLEAYPAVASGDQSVTLTQLYKNYAPQQWVASLVIQNASERTADDVRVLFDNGVTLSLGSLAPGATRLLYLPNLANLPDGYNGSAQVFSTDALPLAVIVNVDARNPGLTAGDYLLSYQGIRTP